jgi:hypothetical protein
VLGDAPIKCECDGGHLVSLARTIYIASRIIPKSVYTSASAYLLAVLVPRLFIPLYYTPVIPTN